MEIRVRPSTISGKVYIPGSKSHTIRALFLASLAHGESEILNPLISEDALSALETCRQFGAEITQEENCFRVKGVGGTPKVPDDVVNVGNSGTTLRFAMMMATLAEAGTVFTGDYQIRRRQVGPLIEAINHLGGMAFSVKGNGSAPVVVRGKALGGKTPIDAFTSQYLSSLLIHAPLMERESEIVVTRLNEQPYVEMTLWWLDRLNIKYKNEGFRKFTIPGGQKYHCFKQVIPGDFSSATFFAVLAAISGGEIELQNLNMTDPQGDKRVMVILENMGAHIDEKKKSVIVKGDALQGLNIDMNSIPDALPALAVAACFAEGETRLVNVPQARTKETDRIAVMCSELKKMGADIEELPDGLVIRQCKLTGARVSGHDDHRVVMALAIAGLCAEGETVIETAEAMNITFPEFVDLVQSCGGDVVWGGQDESAPVEFEATQEEKPQEEESPEEAEIPAADEAEEGNPVQEESTEA